MWHSESNPYFVFLRLPGLAVGNHSTKRGFVLFVAVLGTLGVNLTALLGDTWKVLGLEEVQADQNRE